MAASLYFYIVSALALAQVLSALEVTPGSSCATFCLDFDNGDGFDPAASTTNTSDITCKDAGFSSSDSGIKFKNCLECLQKSEKVNGTESDLKWFIYNMRYTLSTCLFSIPAPIEDAHTDSPCVIDYACNPLKGPITDDNLEPNGTSAWDYCTADDNVFTGSRLNPCISCLQSSGNQVYLSNFVIALEAGCQQAPKDGDLLGLSGSVFTKSAVNATAPEEDIRKKPGGAGTSTMTTGTIVGIVIGIALLFFGGLALFLVHRRRQKKLQRPEKFDSPMPLFPSSVTMSKSLRSYNSEQSFQSDRTGMTMGEYYDKLEEAVQIGGRRNYNFDPRGTSRGPDGALPTHQAYLPTTMSRNTRRILDISTLPATPRAVHTRSQTLPGDSFALRIFGNTVDTSNIPPPPSRRRSATVSQVVSRLVSPPPPPPPPHAQSVPPPPPLPQPIPPPPPQPISSNPPRLSLPKVPTISLPSLSKLRAPKQYAPPMVTKESRELLLPPLTFEHTMSSQTSLDDRQPPGGAMFGLEMPTPGQQLNSSRSEVSMRSGKSVLYGF